MAAHTVIREPQIFSWINIGHARHDNAASVDTQMLVIGNINFFIFLFEDSHQRGELFFRGAGEIPVHKRIIGILLEQVPGD